MPTERESGPPPKRDSEESSTSPREPVDQDELARELDVTRGGTLLLDVRSRWEYRRGHLPGAVHASFFRLRRYVDHLPPDPASPIVVYCGHGPRAWWAARALGRMGYVAVRLLRGHFSAWKRAGRRVTAEEAASLRRPTSTSSDRRSSHEVPGS